MKKRSLLETAGRLLNLIMGSDTAWCIGCGERKNKSRMDFVRGENGLCRVCAAGKHKPQPFWDETMKPDMLMTPFPYTKPIRNAVLAFKFDKCTEYKYIFAHYINEMLDSFIASEKKDWIHEYDMIVPVPISDKRLEERGYNQSALIARETAKHLNLPVSEKALVKIRHTSRQSEVSWNERFENVKGSYRAESEIVSGKRIILVDDVYTSGTTLGECTMTLKNAGAEGVMAITAAKTEREEKSEAIILLEEAAARQRTVRLPRIRLR